MDYIFIGWAYQSDGESDADQANGRSGGSKDPVSGVLLPSANVCSGRNADATEARRTRTVGFPGAARRRPSYDWIVSRVPRLAGRGGRPETS